jgi:hypothetical protein
MGLDGQDHSKERALVVGLSHAQPPNLASSAQSGERVTALAAGSPTWSLRALFRHVRGCVDASESSGRRRHRAAQFARRDHLNVTAEREQR